MTILHIPPQKSGVFLSFANKGVVPIVTVDKHNGVYDTTGTPVVKNRNIELTAVNGMKWKL